MKEKVLKIHEYLQNLSKIKLILCMVTFNVVMFVFFSVCSMLYDIFLAPKIGIDIVNMRGYFLTSIIVLMPMLVLFLSQVLNITYQSFWIDKRIRICIISSLIFSILHSSSLFDLLYGIVLGLVMAYIYIINLGKTSSAAKIAIPIFLISNVITSIVTWLIVQIVVKL